MIFFLCFFSRLLASGHFFPCRCYARPLPSPSPPQNRCDENSGLIAATVGTSAAARVVLPLEGQLEGKAAAAAAATTATNAGDDALFRVPKGLWCYRLDRHRVVLGGALTDGGSVFEWLRGTLGLYPDEEDTDAVMREVEGMPPNSHGLVVSLSCSLRCGVCAPCALCYVCELYESKPVSDVRFRFRVQIRSTAAAAFFFLPKSMSLSVVDRLLPCLSPPFLSFYLLVQRTW